MKQPGSPLPASPTPRAWALALVQDAGLQWPPAGWWQDRHWRLACRAALPVWAALALLPASYLRAPTDTWAWVSLVLVQPLLEEGVFRGLVQGLALGLTVRHGTLLRLGPLSVANALTTALFVAMHLPHQPLAWALAVALPSLVLGHLRERLGSVWPCVLLHAFYNLGFGLTAWGARLLA